MDMDTLLKIADSLEESPQKTITQKGYKPICMNFSLTSHGNYLIKFT